MLVQEVKTKKKKTLKTIYLIFNDYFIILNCIMLCDDLYNGYKRDFPQKGKKMTKFGLICNWILKKMTEGRMETKKKRIKKGVL